jgi:Zn-dependent protease with chaperone function
MNFFEHQELARRNSRRLVVLYALAVAAVVIAVDLVLAAGYVWGFAGARVTADGAVDLAALFLAVPAELYAAGAAGTAALIVGVSAYHVAQLREGGDAIARMVGARLVAPGTRDLLERRLLNVVEEMAIAAGLRVPKVFVMDEERGINAFAAGYAVSSAVVAVTRGALESLNREELQGVIGHEFSHILNGDMRLNIRMMGVLGGIVFIGAAGGFIMRAAGRGRGRRDSAAGGVFLAGLALFVIGYAGLFFARLIKAAVARQREFLADASSVQFTRNPDGIAGALDRIRATGRGALVANRRAEDMSHMYFGQAVRAGFGGLLATHPPLEERIRRVRPGFDVASYRARRAEAAASESETTSAGHASGVLPVGRQGAGRRTGDMARAWTRSTGESAGLVGTLDAGKVDFARRLLATLPSGLRERLTDPEGASAVVVALVLASQESVRAGQLAAARASGVEALADSAQATAPAVQALGPAFHLPLVDLALPALKSAAPEVRERLFLTLEALIHADRRVSLHEFIVLTLVRSQLATPAAGAPIRYRSLAEVETEAALVLSLIAHAGRRPDAEHAWNLGGAFRAGAEEMGLKAPAPLARESLTCDGIGAALETLCALAPRAKAALVKGLFAAVTFDRTVRTQEAELMRFVGAVLDCPLPPLLDEFDPVHATERVPARAGPAAAVSGA